MIATPVEMRETLELVEVLKKLSIRFVPIPIKDNVDLIAKQTILYKTLVEICNESGVE